MMNALREVAVKRDALILEEREKEQAAQGSPSQQPARAAGGGIGAGRPLSAKNQGRPTGRPFLLHCANDLIGGRWRRSAAV